MKQRTILEPALLLGAMLLMSGGCVAPQRSVDLDRSRDALVMRDFDTAQSAADTYLKLNPGGPLTAQAYYLKGRALEDRPAASPAVAKANLQAAREAYIEGLKAVPEPAIEGLLRASLADVAFWQEDFAVAAEQGLSAYPLLTDPDVRAWTLYRAGVAQQRSGAFEQADQTLALVKINHPDTEPADRAADRIGARGFNVQAATFASPQLADNAVSTLTKQGLRVSKQTTAQGRTVILVGPYRTYAEATAARAKLTSTFPDALIVP